MNPRKGNGGKGKSNGDTRGRRELVRRLPIETIRVGLDGSRDGLRYGTVPPWYGTDDSLSSTPTAALAIHGRVCDNDCWSVVRGRFSLLFFFFSVCAALILESAPKCKRGDSREREERGLGGHADGKKCVQAGKGVRGTNAWK